MTSYELLEVNLTPAQSKKLIQAMENRSPVNLTLPKKSIVPGGAYPLMLTKAQMNKVKKNGEDGKGVSLHLSPRQMKESYAVSEQMGTGFIQDAKKWIKKNVLPIAKAVAPVVKPLIKPAVGALAEKAIPGSGKRATDLLGSLGLGAQGGCVMCPMCMRMMGDASASGLSLFGQPLQGNGLSLPGSGLGDDVNTKEQLALF